MSLQRSMSLRVPIEIGMQLSAFASAHGFTAGQAILTLIIHAARNGLGNSLALPGVEIAAKAGLVEIELRGFALRPLTVALAASLAGAIRKVASIPGAGVLDLDTPDTIEISRRGSGVVFSVNRDGAVAFKHVYSCVTAKAIADRIEEAATITAPAADKFEDVEALIGDLDLSAR